MQERINELMRVNQAQEDVHRQQQGHGAPIISLVDGDYRFVALGNVVHWGKKWIPLELGRNNSRQLAQIRNRAINETLGVEEHGGHQGQQQ